MKDSRSVIIRSFIWKLLERCSVRIVSFIVTIVLARLLLPAEYGIVALIAIFIELAEVIADGGFNTALIQKKNADNVDFSTVFFFSLSLAIVLYFILFIVAPYIAIFYNQPLLIPVIRVLGTSLFLYSFNSVQRAYISKYMLFKKLFLSSLLAVILSGIIGIGLAYMNYGVWALVAQTILNQFFTIVIMWVTVRWRPEFVFSKERFFTLFLFGWKIFCTNFVITLFVKTRALVIGRLFSPATLAFYDKGNQFPALISDNVCGSIQAVMFPAFANVQEDRERVKAMMRRSINVSCLFMFPIMIGLITCAKPLVVLLLTDKWLGVVPFMQILCIASLFRPISIPNQQAITALGYSDITLKLELARKVIDVTLLVISCLFGALAIAWGVVAFNFICLFVNLYPNAKILNYKIREQFSDVLPMLFISMVMGGIIWGFTFLQLSPVLTIFIQIIVGVITYLTLCWVFKIESFNYIIHIIKNNNSKDKNYGNI